MNTYSKVYTQFETQAMAFGRLRVALKDKYIVRGYNGYISVLQPTHINPIPILKIVVRSSSTPDEVGFFKKSETEAIVIGMNIAWDIASWVLPMLPQGEG